MLLSCYMAYYVNRNMTDTAWQTRGSQICGPRISMQNFISWENLPSGIKIMEIENKSDICPFLFMGNVV